MEKYRDDLKKEKAARMKKERQEQVDGNRQFREEEMRKKRQEEKSMMNQIKEELERERKQTEDEKLQKKLHMNKILVQSEEERRIKAQKAKEDSQAEMDRCRAFNRALDEKDEAKRKEAEAKSDEQKRNLLKMKAIIEAQTKDSGEQNEKLAAMQKAEADARAQAILQHREDRLKDMRQQNQAFLIHQMEENKMRKQQEADLNEVHAMILGAENRAF